MTGLKVLLLATLAACCAAAADDHVGEWRALDTSDNSTYACAESDEYFSTYFDECLSCGSEHELIPAEASDGAVNGTTSCVCVDDLDNGDFYVTAFAEGADPEFWCEPWLVTVDAVSSVVFVGDVSADGGAYVGACVGSTHPDKAMAFEWALESAEVVADDVSISPSTGGHGCEDGWVAVGVWVEGLPVGTHWLAVSVMSEDGVGPEAWARTTVLVAGEPVVATGTGGLCSIPDLAYCAEEDVNSACVMNAGAGVASFEAYVDACVLGDSAEDCAAAEDACFADDDCMTAILSWGDCCTGAVCPSETYDAVCFAGATADVDVDNCEDAACVGTVLQAAQDCCECSWNADCVLSLASGNANYDAFEAACVDASTTECSDARAACREDAACSALLDAAITECCDDEASSTTSSTQARVMAALHRPAMREAVESHRRSLLSADDDEALAAYDGCHVDAQCAMEHFDPDTDVFLSYTLELCGAGVFFISDTRVLSEEDDDAEEPDVASFLECAAECLADEDCAAAVTAIMDNCCSFAESFEVYNVCGDTGDVVELDASTQGGSLAELAELDCGLQVQWELPAARVIRWDSAPASSYGGGASSWSDSDSYYGSYGSDSYYYGSDSFDSYYYGSDSEMSSGWWSSAWTSSWYDSNSWSAYSGMGSWVPSQSSWSWSSTYKWSSLAADSWSSSSTDSWSWSSSSDSDSWSSASGSDSNSWSSASDDSWSMSMSSAVMASSSVVARRLTGSTGSMSMSGSLTTSGSSMDSYAADSWSSSSWASTTSSAWSSWSWSWSSSSSEGMDSGMMSYVESMAMSYVESMAMSGSMMMSDMSYVESMAMSDMSYTDSMMMSDMSYFDDSYSGSYSYSYGYGYGSSSFDDDDDHTYSNDGSCEACYGALFGMGNGLMDALVVECMADGESDECHDAVEACGADDDCKDMAQHCESCQGRDECEAGDVTSGLFLTFADEGTYDLSVSVYAASTGTMASADVSVTISDGGSMCVDWDGDCLTAVARDSHSDAVSAFVADCVAEMAWGEACWAAANWCVEDDFCLAAMDAEAFDVCCNEVETEAPCAADGFDPLCLAEADANPAMVALATCVEESADLHDCFDAWVACSMDDLCEPEGCCADAVYNDCDTACWQGETDNAYLQDVGLWCFLEGDDAISETLDCAVSLAICDADAECAAAYSGVKRTCDCTYADVDLLPDCSLGYDEELIGHYAGVYADVELLAPALEACLSDDASDECDALWDACMSDVECAEAGAVIQFNSCGEGMGEVDDGFGESDLFTCNSYDDLCVAVLAVYHDDFSTVVDECYPTPLTACEDAEEACLADADCADIADLLPICCMDADAVIVPGDDNVADSRWDADLGATVFYYVDAPASVELDGSESVGDSLVYLWSTGAETAAVDVDSAEDDDVAISLFVVDSYGKNDSDSALLSFWESPQVTVDDAGMPDVVMVGEAFDLSGSAVVGRGDATFVWTATPISKVLFSDRYAESTAVTVTAAVDFTVTLTVTTTDGFIEVEGAASVADSAYEAPSVSLADIWVGLGTHTLQASVSTSDGGDVTYLWSCDAGCDFGDETAASPDVAFAEAGTFEVMVTVTSVSSGLEASASATVTVLGPDVSFVVAGGYADPAVVDPGVDTTLVSTSYSSLAPADSAEAGLEVQWFWVSGPACVNDTVCPVEIADAAAEETAVTGLDASGEFVFNVSAVDSLETRAWALVSVYVNNLPQVELGDHHTYWADDHPQWVWLNATASDVEDNGLTWSWVIGDTCDISTVEIEDPSAANTRVRGVGVGICEFEFTATDGDGSSTTEVQAVQVASVTITSPTADDAWFQGSKYAVTWEAEGINTDNANVFLQLREDGAGIGLAREFAYPDTTSKTYSVPFDYSGVYYNGPAFTLLIRVRDYTYGYLAVESETEDFSIAVPYSFSAGDWGECELPSGTTCGDGTQTRTVECIEVATQTAAGKYKCSAYETAPDKTQDCFSCGDYRFDISAWSACSASCGGGTKTRTADCQVAVGSSYVAASIDDCTAAGMTVPASSASCNWQTCITYSWKTGATGTCSQSCGGGTAFVDVYCQSSQGTRVAQSKCDAGTKPAATTACNTDACPEHYWQYSKYGRCSATCGGGTKTRTAECIENGAAIDDASVCTADVGAATALSKTCNLQSCDVYSLVVGDWSDCLDSSDAVVTCGGGTRTRDVLCLLNGDALDSTDACASSAGLNVPRSSQACANARCADQFCDGETCSFHGTCADNACACDTGYSGTYCQTADTCDGTTAADGSCCESGVVNNAGECCTGDSPVRDVDGACCDGTLDVCGVCNGDAVVVDISGTCCAGELDGGYSCCEDEVDTCGICGGDGTSCKTQSDIAFNSDNDDVDTSNEDTIATYQDAIAALFGIAGNRISMGDFGVAADSRRRRLATDYSVDFAVEPSATDETVVNLLTVAEDMANAEADDIPGASSVTPGEVEAAGVCGNDIIESGECCAADGSDALTCCSADCPYSFNECPTPEGGDEVCGGRGTCIASSGACECYESLGYSGDDCSECASGFFDDGEGNCAVYVEVIIAADDDSASGSGSASAGDDDDATAGDDDSSAALGAAIGGAVGGALFMAAVFMCCRKRRSDKVSNKPTLQQAQPAAAPSFQPTTPVVPTGTTTAF